MCNIYSDSLRTEMAVSSHGLTFGSYTVCRLDINVANENSSGTLASEKNGAGFPDSISCIGS